MAAWRPEVVEGGLADRPAACPRCGRAWRRRRPWKEAVLDLVEDAAVLVCLLWLGGVAGAGAVAPGGARPPPGLLLLRRGPGEPGGLRPLRPAGRGRGLGGGRGGRREGGGGGG